MMSTYVILFSGGINDFANYPRYAADLSLLLVGLNGFPGLTPAGISILLGPGGGAFEYNGTAITAANSSRSMLEQTIANVAASASTNDRLLFFASNHGGQKVKGQNSSTLYCWGSETVLPNDLLQWFGAVRCQFQAFVFGQCYSGGFIDGMKMQNRAILTACSFDEVSWASSATSYKYDEFIYRVSEALVARTDTLTDIFLYAQKADLEKETPQFSDGGIGAISLWAPGT
jgi:hypothetical protein